MKCILSPGFTVQLDVEEGDEKEARGFKKKAGRQALEPCFDESYLERLFILVLLLELKQECWSLLKPNT